MSDELLDKVEDGILTITINRPEKLNAMTFPMMGRLLTVLEDAANEPSIRVVVLTGAGKGFCAGGDIYTGERLDESDPVAVRWHQDPQWNSMEMRISQTNRYARASGLLHDMPKPTIAMVRGAAAGSGLSLAAACDLRIASTTAMFTTAFVSAARSGDYGGSYLLTHLLGPAKARELYLLGEKVNAEEALRIGLVNRVVPDEELETAVAKIAGKLAKGPPVAYRYIKRNLNAAEMQSLQEVMELETEHMLRCSQSKDARELAQAARERRLPVYKGW
jgi:2-(1,2-epoxy-1,2-dihydrophenyl)acetyl-CoA isomerase